MQMIGCIVLCIVGHVIRDGYPSLGAGMTFVARLLGGLLCAAAGYVAVQSLEWVIVGASIGVGFWLDWHHADGQQARDIKDAAWLAVTGISSLALFAIAVSIFYKSPYFGLLVLSGAAKVPIWFACWRVVPQGVIFQPTRVAAGLFGAVAGALIYWAA